MVKVRVVPINKIISEAVSNIKSSINNTGKVKSQINIGKATGIGFLSNIGPKFYIKMETARSE